MISPTYKSMIVRLDVLTKAGSAFWKSTSVSDQYSLKLKTGALLFDKYSAEDAGELGYYYGFKLLDKVGNVVDHFDIYENEPEFPLVDSLWELVENTFNAEIRTRRSIVDEIASSQRLGEE
jgi:hypothetical protein